MYTQLTISDQEFNDCVLDFQKTLALLIPDIEVYLKSNTTKILPVNVLRFPVRNKDEIIIVQTAQVEKHSALIIKLISFLEEKIENIQLKKTFETTKSRFETIFYQSPLSIQICSKEGKTLHVNPAWKKLWNIPEEIIQNFILKDYNMLKDPHLEAQGVLPFIKKGFSGEVSRIPIIDYNPNEIGIKGTTQKVEGIIFPLKDEAGNVKEIVLIHTDVTNERKAIRHQQIIGRLTSILITTIDYEKIIHSIAEAIVPEFTDSLIIDILEGDKIKRLLIKHKDERIQFLMNELKEKFPPHLDSPQPPSIAIKTGISHLQSQLTAEQIRNSTFNKEHEELIREIGIKSYIAVPLIKRNQVIGSLCLMNTTDRAPFDADDLKIAEEVAQAASIALDNAALFLQSQKAISQRDDFISIASHELKTPLTSMQLQLQAVERSSRKSGEQMVEVEKLLKLTDSSLKQLKRINVLVEDMLDISRISSGKLGVNLTLTNLSLIVEEVLHRFSNQLNAHKIPLISEIQPGITAMCDAFRWEQVLINLLTNAIKYGENKPIEVSFKADEKNIFLKVRDHGIGIDSKDQERIFNRFERAVSLDNISGLGLGLYIARQIMQAHNGNLIVESTPGEGSTFTAILPL